MNEADETKELNNQKEQELGVHYLLQLVIY